MEKNTIAIIDTGIDKTHPIFNGKQIIESYIVLEDGSIDVNVENGDCLGHGTGVSGIIIKGCPDVNIIHYKVFDNEYITSDFKLLSALRHIRMNKEINIIHMSLGINTNSSQLYNECKLLNEAGKLLIAAFDNSGYVSYPAAYDCVIGVDIDSNCKKRDEYIFYENNIINIGVMGGMFRVADVNHEYAIRQGTSYAAAFFTGHVANIVAQEMKHAEYEQAIKDNAIKVVCCEKKLDITEDIPFKINRAMVFPYNKEIHALVNFQDLLPFKIAHICDIKYSGNTNKSKKTIFGNEIYIENYEECNYNDIDTIIVGHLDKIILLLGENFLLKFVQIIVKKQLNIYAFDDIILNYLPKYSLSKIYIVQNPSYIRNNNRLHYIEKPVLAILGTSSFQGKYTIQLQIRRLFQKLGYKVGQLGTEPTAKLFGFDYQYVYGYSVSEEKLENRENIISMLNLMMHVVDTKDCDIIIAGAQSGTVPLLFNNIGQFPLRQQEFLLGVMPDYVVLCVNLYDDFDYIERSIKYIEGFTESSVIALAINPLVFKNEWLSNYGVRHIECDDIISKYQEKAEGQFGIKSCIIGNEQSVAELVDFLIHILSDNMEE